MFLIAIWFCFLS